MVCAEDITSAGDNIRRINVVLANSPRVLIEITRGADSIDSINGFMDLQGR